MQELVQYYKEFLKSRNLEKFDGRILCRYQMTEEEFLRLENLLKSVNLGNTDKVKTIIAPLFVLYASESWRRNFSGNLWTWTTVLTNLGQGDLANIRHKYVEKGFRFLQRELRITHNQTRFLGSIAIESGIPVQILENQGNNLRSVIEEVFKSLEDAITNLNPIDLVQEIAKRKLPNTYHNDSFFLLLYDFASALQKLSRKYHLDEQQNPMEYLDQNHPHWNNELPIVVNQQNSTFFNVLLSDVAEITRTINNKLKINYFLRTTNEVNALYFNISLKSGVYSPEVLGITESEFNQLPNRFVLMKNQGESSSHLGYFDKVGNGEKFRVENLSNHNVPVSFHDDTFYYLSDFENDVKIDLNLNVIDFKNNDAPLLFLNEHNKWKLKAVGSSKIKESTYRVLTSTDSVITNGNHLPFNLSTYKLLEFTQETSITNNDGSIFYTKFSQTQDCNRFDWLRINRSLKFAENENKSVFIGFPHLLKYNSHGQFLGRYDTNELQVFLDENWIPINDAPRICGRVKIRLCIDGITEFSSWINSLPKDFEFIIQQGRKTIVLNNLPPKTSIILENQHFEINDHMLLYTGNSKQAEFTKLLLKSEVVNKPIVITMPLPIQGSFFTKQGVLLENRAELTMNQLKGVRLSLFNLEDKQVHKSVLINLQNSNKLIQKTYLLAPYSSKEIPLLNLKNELVSLFSMENSQDSEIAIESDNQFLVLKKYNSKPIFSQEANTYKFPENNSKVNIFRLDQDFSVQQVQELSINSETQQLEKEPDEGLYFVFSPDESENYFRPIALIKNVVSVDFDDDTDFSDWNFSQIAKVNDSNDFKRGYQLRRKAIKQRLKSIAHDFSHDEWKNNLIPLSEYFKQSSLTLSSLDLFKHAASSDTVLASLFFHLDNDFIHQFSNEFSVVWRKIAISKWQKSFEAYKQYFTHLLGDNQLLVDSVISQKIELLDAFDLGNVKAILSQELQIISVDILKIMLPGLLNDLRLRHVDNNWYNQTKKEVSSWFVQCNLPMKLDTELLELLNRGHQFEYCIKFFPIVLAYASVHNINLNNLEDANLKYEVLKMRAFDPEWYNTIYDYFQSYFYAQEQAQLSVQNHQQLQK